MKKHEIAVADKKYDVTTQEQVNIAYDISHPEYFIATIISFYFGEKHGKRYAIVYTLKSGKRWIGFSPKANEELRQFIIQEYKDPTTHIYEEDEI